MNALEIIQLLETPSKDTVEAIQTKDKILAEASTAELISALQKSPDVHLREILCDLLGVRADAIAIPELVNALHDSSAAVRGSAADALAKIGDPTAGEALLEQYFKESDDAIRQLIAIALGAVKYQPAIPTLVQALSSSIAMMRKCAAWALKDLKAREAKQALEDALSRETDASAARAMQCVLDVINESAAS
jgi:HEAT repeat protein